MRSLFKVVTLLLLGTLGLGLVGCAETRDTPPDDQLSASEAPSKDDASHGWSANIAH